MFGFGLGFMESFFSTEKSTTSRAESVCNFLNKLTPQNRQHNLLLFGYCSRNIVIYMQNLNNPSGEINYLWRRHDSGRIPEHREIIDKIEAQETLEDIVFNN